MAQSDARFGYKANLNRQDFNLSQRLGFTSASGMLLPIWSDIATPGDSYYMQHDLPLLRSTVLAAPAMVDVKVHFDTFFVPFQMIYQPIEETLFSLKSPRSSSFDMTQLMNNTLPLFDYSSYISAILTGHSQSVFRADAFRLADLFGLCPDNFRSLSGFTLQESTFSPSFFPWQLLVYHTIFAYYYRLDDKTQFNNDICNWDAYYNQASFGYPNTPRFMQIHQRPWDFDYFTSLYRSPISSDVNLQSLLPGSTYSKLLPNMNIQPVNDAGSPDPGNSNVRGFSDFPGNPVTTATVRNALTTAAVRQMFANEKLAMITGRTKKNYDSQVLAHYGVNVPHDVKHDLTLIHHDTYDLNVQEVTSLSSTTDAALGELAGKAYAAGNGEKFMFTAPCHGFIMTIFSIEPKRRYFDTFDRINAITNAFDFPVPEFDRMGNVPMFRYESGFSVGLSGAANTDIIGWKERYYWNKRKFDRTTYAFGETDYLHVNNYGAYMLTDRPFGTSGATRLPGAQRPDLEDRFYIPRGACDNLCLVSYYNGWKVEEEVGDEDWTRTPWLLYSRDPFIVNSHIKCTKVSWMSKDGEPIYNF